MKEPSKTDGDLIAHIHNDNINDDSTSNIQSELDSSPDLAALSDLDALLQNAYGGSARPDPQDLVDVLMEQATPNQKLIVAAYVRDSERGQREMDALRAELVDSSTAQIETQASESIVERLARYIATPVALNMGLRTASRERDRDSEQMTFEVADLHAMVTLRIVPPTRERWRIEGYITQNYAPIADAQLMLRAAQAQPNQCVTDSEGFFELQDLTTGQYTLEITLQDAVIVIPELTLMEQDG